MFTPINDESQGVKDFLEGRTNTFSSADVDPVNAAYFQRYERAMEAKRSGDLATASTLLAQSCQPPSIYKGHYRELFKMWRAMNRKDLKAGKHAEVIERVTTMVRFDDEMIDVMLKHWGQVQRRGLPDDYFDMDRNLLKSDAKALLTAAILAQVLRRALLARGERSSSAVMARIGPWSIGALLATLVLLFAFQGKAILEQPLVIAMLAVPILIQVLFNSGLAYWLNRAVGETHSVACPSALIGASNFFELAVAAAISIFGFHSGAALATVVGVLIEVPVMLLVVRVVNRTRGWYEAG